LTYYTPDYETKDTDILAAFQVTPQPGVPPEEAWTAVAAESSTGTWTTVWTDGLTSLDRYKGRCYHIEPVAGEESQFIAYVAYPLDLFEEGSVTLLPLWVMYLDSRPCVLYVWRICESLLLILKLSKARLTTSKLREIN